jgi:pimeloyl-ACP methyl ester carboxylesterase
MNSLVRIYLFLSHGAAYRQVEHMNNDKSKNRPILKFFVVGCGTITVLVVAIIIWIVVSLFSGPGVMEMTTYHPFSSEKAKERYLKPYDMRAKKWQVASETMMVETSYGQTFVRISGPNNAPPLVLLPGGGCNSLMWMQVIDTLSESYRTYAVDNIYDFGRSVYTRPITTTDDLLKWLDELFSTLALGDDINLIGLSYGGWLASQYTLHAPIRLDKVVLLAPVATVIPLSLDLVKRMIFSILPHHYFFKSTVYWIFEDAVNKDEISRNLVDEHIADAYLGLRSFKLKQPPSPTVLRDDELQGIKVPMLFLVGENEKIYDAQVAVKRINEIAPQIETDIIPNCGHDLLIAQTEIVNRKVLEFLKRP